MFSMELNTKVKIPKSKNAKTSGTNFEHFIAELKPEWKYLLVNFYEDDDYNVGVCGPNREYISHDSFYATDLELYEKSKVKSIKDCIKESIKVKPVDVFDTVVNHPKHYGGDDIYETIKVIDAWQLNFNLGNCIKYISRADKKDSTIQDLKKAKWYLEREISKLEK